MALIGELSETHFSDLIQLYVTGRQTAAVWLTAPNHEEGVFYVLQGDVVDAQLGPLVGRDAIRRALSLSGGSFRVEPDVVAPSRTIHQKWTHVLLDELVKLDEEQQRLSGKAVPAPPQPRASKARGPGPTPTPAPVPLAARGETGALEPAPAPAMPTPTATPPPLALTPPAVPLAAAPPVPLAATAPPVPEPEKEAAPLFSKPPSRALWASPAGRAALVGASVAVIVAGFVLASQKRSGLARPAYGLAGVEPTPTASSPELLLGMSAAFSGANREIGRGMKTGLELAFAAANEAGGVGGRKLRLVALDDGNEPSRAAPAMRELLDDRKVFAVVGSVGSAGAAAALPLALERKVVYFGAMAGGDVLRRSPPDRYVFNFRPGYGEEAAAAVRYLTKVRRFEPEELAFFGQDDGYGEAGWNGLARELDREGKSAHAVLRTGYRRNTADVGKAVAKIRKKKGLKAVVMLATYEPASRFIQALKESGSHLVYTNASAVEAGVLAERLMEARVPLADDVVVTQVVPLPTSQASSVIEYRRLLATHAQGENPGPLSLEGYLAGRLFVEALKRAGPELSGERLVSILEDLHDLDLGIGVRLGFSPSEHQASHKIWGTLLQPNGTYRSVDLE